MIQRIFYSEPRAGGQCLPGPFYNLFLSAVGRGHTRPMVGLALNLLKLFPKLYITYMVPAAFHPIVQKDVELFQPAEDVELRFRLVPLGSSDIDRRDFVSQTNSFIEELPSFLASIVPISKGNDSIQSPEGFNRAPTLAIVDVRVINQIYSSAKLLT